MNQTAVAKLISTLFASRIQAHIFHLQTSSFAAHKALGEFYEGIEDLADSYVESWQGKYGQLLTGYQAPTKYVEGDAEVLQYFMELQQFVQMIRGALPEETELDNIADDIQLLIDSTIYKLKFLK